MRKELILGGPGAGKTTALINKYRGFMEDGLDPAKMLLITFTRKAQQEVKGRLGKELDVPNSMLSMVRTFHSFLWTHVLGWSLLQTFRLGNLVHFGKNYNYTFEVLNHDNLEVSNETVGGSLLNLLALKRVTDKSYREIIQSNTLKGIRTDVTAENLEKFHNEYEKFKAQYHLRDYTDCFIEVLKLSPEALGDWEVIMVDEAQDLNHLMWEVIKRLEGRTKHMIFAGDDDQSIYAFGGGDIDAFLALGSMDYEKITLPKSHRMKSRIFEFSQEWIKQLGTNRYDKNFAPNSPGGELNFALKLDYTNIHKPHKSCLLMASANYMLKRYYIPHLIREGLPFMHKERSSLHIPGLRGYLVLLRLEKGEEVRGEEIKIMYDALEKEYVKHGFKMGKTLHDDDVYSLDSLREFHGLELATDEINMNCFKMTTKNRAYVEAVIKNGYKLDGEPWIDVSTIHGAKGGEADIVVLVPELSAAQLQADKASLIRQFYVAVTRAKEQFIVLDIKVNHTYYDFVNRFSEFKQRMPKNG